MSRFAASSASRWARNRGLAAPAYSRVLLKISGEALAGGKGAGFDFDTLNRIAGEIKQVVELGIGVGMVIGGGNIVRGAQFAQHGMDRVGGDYMGMLGTVINALAVQDVLERQGIETRVMTAINMEQIAEPFIRRRALRHFEKGRVVIFAAGTGNPYFSTDTAAALRAIEIGADVVIKATKVDGVYDSDPKKNSSAVKFDSMTHLDFLSRRLTVMDSTAVTLCMENNLPIMVLNFWDTNALTSALRGEPIGTLVSG